MIKTASNATLKARTTRCRRSSWHPGSLLFRRSRDFRSGAFASFLASGRRARIVSFDNPWSASGELPETFVCVAAQIIVNCLQDFYRVVGVLHGRRQME